MAAKPMSVEELADLASLKPKEIKETLVKMGEDYNHHGIELLETEGLFELRVKAEHSDVVSKLAPDQDFSRAILQTLSAIAYKNPVKQSKIVRLRGNRAYDHLKELISRGFIRKEPHGHTQMISVTSKFLEYFGLRTPEELKEYFESQNESNQKEVKQGETHL